MRRAGGWRHIASVLDEKRGVVFDEGERIVAALQVPDSGREPRSDAGVLHVRCSRCGGRLRMGSYVLPVGVSVLCERCSDAR
jgi:hypothetical protein